ncbi:MAG: hypothetical protein M3R02_28625, partial [Chloroflexota bacterium]|nr:hypothetical protein [Chloroflexota bacterium]
AAATIIASNMVRLLPDLFTTLPLRSCLPGPFSPRGCYGKRVALGSTPEAGGPAPGPHVGPRPLSLIQV